jgi:general secretion pathway protein E
MGGLGTPALVDIPEAMGFPGAAPEEDFSEAFGQRLIEANLLDAGSLERAKRAASTTGERFDHVLAKLGLVPEAALLETLARHLGTTVATAQSIPTAPVLPEIIRPEFIRSRQVLPLGAEDGCLAVAAVDPFDDEPLEALAYLTGHSISILLISPGDFAQAVASIYGERSETGRDRLDPRVDDANEADVERLRDIANEAPFIRLVNQIIADAVDNKSSDIHLEPGVDGVVVRFRIDGHLRESQVLSSGLRAAVTSRLKIMAKLDIAERRMPQDGRIKVPVRGVDIDFRVSTVPTVYGESVVMRILDRSRVELDFVKLGFDPERIAALEALMDQPNGIVLVTGPTGSGKTTTLYTALKGLNRPDVKVFTVEDPIEYEIARINQIQVHPEIGLDFPHALRSILRQDPDIIMIGEIRDLETARIAIQASLTGHLVFSTLHTNSSAATVTRLIDMGVENYLLASTVNGILAQRLVRRLCAHCATPHPNAAQWRQHIEREIPGSHISRELKVLKPVGCEVCHATGFSGRLAIAELLTMNEERRALILAGATDLELEAAARRGGMRTMYQDGLDKVARGLTTIEEVLRVTRMSSS